MRRESAPRPRARSREPARSADAEQRGFARPSPLSRRGRPRASRSERAPHGRVSGSRARGLVAERHGRGGESSPPTRGCSPPERSREAPGERGVALHEARARPRRASLRSRGNLQVAGGASTRSSATVMWDRPRPGRRGRPAGARVARRRRRRAPRHDSPRVRLHEAVDHRALASRPGVADEGQHLPRVHLERHVGDGRASRRSAA